MFWQQSIHPYRRALSQAGLQFKAVPAGPVVVRHDRSLDSLEVDLFCVAAHQQVADVERILGARLRPWWRFRPRLAVYLFPTAADVSKVYGAEASGFADAHHWEIAVNLESNWIGILRHELTHVVAYDWNQNPLTILCEGLAVWTERAINGCSINEQANRWQRDYPAVLGFLLGPEPPYCWRVRHPYYMLAGSFVGAVIDRFGLPRFRQFYRDRLVDRETFSQRFGMHFQAPLQAFVQRWLSSLKDTPTERIRLARMG